MKNQEITERIEKAEAELKQLREELNREEVTYGMGSVFKDEFGDKYLLAQVCFKEACLIHMKSGNRYDEPISILDGRFATESEFNEICSGGNFTKI